MAAAHERNTGLELEGPDRRGAPLRHAPVSANCLGLIRPAAKLNATFSKNDAQPGTLALVSQSGALCTAILDWARRRTGSASRAWSRLGDGGRRRFRRDPRLPGARPGDRQHHAVRRGRRHARAGS
ncbi:MAG: hypothetical protein MZV65_34295 [Chromatiales bacterium]|nr:hypothetical protein [Chromatiales bacterium]